jgi:hypothetical protein
MQGRDLFDGGQAAPDSWLVEEDALTPLFGETGPDRVRTLIADGWRLSWHQGAGWWEMYDLVNDPGEVINLWGDPAHRDRAAALLERMVARMTALEDTSPLPTGRA